MKAYIGIDPGASGSIGIIMEDGKKYTYRFSKHTEKETCDFLLRCGMEWDCFAVKEKVWAMPAKNTDGTQRSMGAQTMFTFGDGNGFIRACLIASTISFEEKVPQTWQKIFGMKKDKGEDPAAYKRRLKQKAEELFPDMKLTLEDCDAILIAEYCRRTRV